MTKEQAIEWAKALKRDKTVGDGVTYILEQDDENHQSIDDIYEDFNFYMIARILNEPIWNIDFALYTMDSLLHGEERSSIPSEDFARLIEEYGTPYTVEGFETLLEDYPIGAAQD